MTWTCLKLTSTIAALVMTMSLEAAAQSEPEFLDAFSGVWQVYDDGYADGSPCEIRLSKEQTESGLALETSSCKLELAEVSHWEIVDGQLALKIGADTVAMLGGSQQRISGSTAIGAPLIMERPEPSETTKQVTAARQSSGCYFLGFTNNCADDDQLKKPAVAGDGSGARINVLVNLNARVEARDGAGILGVVPANTCIVADVCQEASDGVWCRARFGEDFGWLKKVALRQERWPVLTFTNQCPG